MYLKEEWHARRIVMEAALEVLSDGQPKSSIEVHEALSSQGLTVPKKLVNSVLFSEARRYVSYDFKKFTYQLRVAKDDKLVTVPVITKSPETKPSHVNGVKPDINARYIGRNDEFVFSATDSTGPAFFETESRSRTIQIALNRQHPLFADLKDLLQPGDNDDCDELRNKVLQARETVELLLAAWSRYEADLPIGPRKHRAEEARMDWGRTVRSLIVNDQDDDE